ncbi:uncharacterized protein F5147DRAFT_9353 [Suillus discolor]|uniref:Uncharacterized protein n=1 Tax=Suillus discolor TaxID=1912936 RepID=A0A9P7FJS4_9AGAM|nr:uncharacterized protein F5147DRAFT_9353 [Suillus discolor]KAG2120795.1 hypothetical protein F5147DRAFT_9353 [Suillus discolor]
MVAEEDRYRVADRQPVHTEPFCLLNQEWFIVERWTPLDRDPPPSKSSDQHNEGYEPPSCLIDRAENAGWLRAQATPEFPEIKHLCTADTRAGDRYQDPWHPGW